MNSKTETIINESDINDVFEKIQKFLGKGSSWIVDSVIDHNINISNYNPSAGSSYIKLPKELNHSKNGLINIQNINDNECFKWCLFRYLHPADHHPGRIRKIDRLIVDKLYSQNIYNILTKLIKNSINISVFGFENKVRYQIYVSKNTLRKNMFIYY